MDGKVFARPAIDLPKVPEASLGLRLGSPSWQKGASSEGQSASGALGPPQSQLCPDLDSCHNSVSCCTEPRDGAPPAFDSGDAPHLLAYVLN